MKTIIIPKGCLAADDEALRLKREELKKKLLEGKPVSFGKAGNVTGSGNDVAGIIPPGKLAGDLSPDEALKIKRMELKKRLLEGKRVAIGNGGNVMTPEASANIVIPKGVLAVSQWYESNPQLLEAEKMAMNRAFPDFTLDKLSDGRLCWIGEIGTGIMGDNKWTVMAVYNNNHPAQVMGSSVRVYLVEPDVDELIEGLGVRPLHLLMDSNNQYYLCTAQAEDIKTGSTTTSAASVMAWAVKWICAFELTLTGEISWDEFNTHGVI